jgi:hypothetical protein
MAALDHDKGKNDTLSFGIDQSRSCMYQGYVTGRRETLLRLLADSRGRARSNPARFCLS